IDARRVAFCGTENIGTPNLSYAARYLACALPCERFTSALASTRASLGAGVARYAFTATDLHRLLSAGLPAHPSIHGTQDQRERPQHWASRGLWRVSSSACQADASEVVADGRRGGMGRSGRTSCAARAQCASNNRRCPVLTDK